MVKKSPAMNIFINTAETLVLGAFLGFVPIYLCLIAAIIITSLVPGKDALGPWVLLSLVPALLIDIIFLKRWVKNAYQINGKIMAIIYLFYSIISLGMCMGIPIGALVLGTGAGLYSARKIQKSNDTLTQKQALRKTAFFSASVMTLMCVLITIWAIAGKMIGYKLETPFQQLTLTVPVFILIVLFGGAILVSIQYFLTIFAAKITMKLLSANS